MGGGGGGIFLKLSSNFLKGHPPPFAHFSLTVALMKPHSICISVQEREREKEGLGVGNRFKPGAWITRSLSVWCKVVIVMYQNDSFIAHMGITLYAAQAITNKSSLPIYTVIKSSLDYIRLVLYS